jgi:tryptophan synthase beta subunit
MKYTVNEKGYYGEFGGAWIPEMMYTNIDELNAVIWKSLNRKNSNPSSIIC